MHLYLSDADIIVGCPPPRAKRGNVTMNSISSSKYTCMAYFLINNVILLCIQRTPAKKKNSKAFVLELRICMLQ